VEGGDFKSNTNMVADTFKDYVECFHGAFPQYMDEENLRYIEDINKVRIEKGLRSLQW